MSDLISRQALIEELCNGCDMSACDGNGRDSTAKCYSVRLVEEAPTAYDADKVVAEMKANSFERYRNVGMGGQMVVDLSDALEIVKAGGLNG